MPFSCPTCQGNRVIPNTAGGEVPCFTCKGVGSVDPGNPPYAPGWRGGLRIGWKIFFGGG